MISASKMATEEDVFELRGIEVASLVFKQEVLQLLSPFEEELDLEGASSKKEGQLIPQSSPWHPK